MAEDGDFDPNFFLSTRYADLDVKNRGILGQFHQLFHARGNDLTSGGRDLRVLDYGCGPVLQHSISAAKYATEIVFCDISPANRVAIQKWLNGDADAFDWSRHFDYVVKNLEGKEGEEAREREQRMRQISKVAFCDALSDTPMEKGYEGPYDIILQCGCLEAACSTRESYEKCMKTIEAHLKPGGIMVNVATNGKEDYFDLKYTVGGSDHSCIRLTAQYVEMVFAQCGLVDIQSTVVPFEPNSWLAKKNTDTADGIHFIHGTKPSI